VPDSREMRSPVKEDMEAKKRELDKIGTLSY
jgi:hypothetical protein